MAGLEISGTGGEQMMGRSLSTNNRLASGTELGTTVAPRFTFLLVVFLFWVTQWANGDAALSFVRSLVVCDKPTPTGEDCVLGVNRSFTCMCSVGTFYDNTTDDCEVTPPGQSGWSTSGTCPDLSFVAERASTVGGMIFSIVTLGSAVGVLTFGAMFTDIWGRRPMMLISFLAQFWCSTGFALVGYYKLDLDASLPLIYVAAGFGAFFDTFSVAGGSMAVDGTEPDSTERSESLVARQVVIGVAGMFNTGSGVYLLSLSLTDYTMVWTGFSLWVLVRMGIAWAVLVETKPTIPTEETATCGDATAEIRAGFEIVGADPKLRNGVLIFSMSISSLFCSFFVFPTWTLVVLGLTQAQAALVGVVLAVFTLIGAATTTAVIGKIGQLGCIYMALASSTIGFATIGASSFLGSTSALHIMFWLGVVCVAFSQGMQGPAVEGLLSSRVAPENQGKFFSVLNVVLQVGVSLGVYITSNVALTDPNRIKEQMISTLFVLALTQILGALGWYCSWADGDPPKLVKGGSQLTFSKGRSGSRILVLDSGVDTKAGEVLF